MMMPVTKTDEKDAYMIAMYGEKDVYKRQEVTYLDVWGALADHEGRLDKRYTNDGLHLTGEGYVVWRDAIKQHVK